MSHDRIRASILRLVPPDGSAIGNGRMRVLLADTGRLPLAAETWDGRPGAAAVAA